MSTNPLESRSRARGGQVRIEAPAKTEVEVKHARWNERLGRGSGGAQCHLDVGCCFLTWLGATALCLLFPHSADPVICTCVGFNVMGDSDAQVIVVIR